MCCCLSMFTFFYVLSISRFKCAAFGVIPLRDSIVTRPAFCFILFFNLSSLSHSVCVCLFLSQENSKIIESKSTDMRNDTQEKEAYNCNAVALLLLLLLLLLFYSMILNVYIFWILWRFQFTSSHPAHGGKFIIF